MGMSRVFDYQVYLIERVNALTRQIPLKQGGESYHLAELCSFLRGYP